MKVQELFEAKQADPEKEQEDFERKTMMPVIKQLLGTDKVKNLGTYPRLDADTTGLKPKKTKTLKWTDPDGFESVYDLKLFTVKGDTVVKIEYNDYGGGCDPTYVIAKAAKVTEAAEMTPAALRTAIKKVLKGQRIQPASEETTQGALKTWFDVLTGKKVSMKGLAALLKNNFPDQHVMFSGGKVMGDGFNLELENEGDGLYLAVFTKGSAGQHHKMGLDN